MHAAFLAALSLIAAISWSAAAVALQSGSVSAGYAYTMVLKADGSLWSWGGNVHGQLGDGTKLDRALPVLIGHGYRTVSAKSYHTLALKPDGSLWAWGSNDAGQLGDGSYIDQDLPVMVGSGYIAAASGLYHSMALRSDGSLWAWGENYSGQLGDGTVISRVSPVLILSGVSAIASGYDHSLAIMFNGDLLGWGMMQLADGSVVQQRTPILIGSGYSAVTAGISHSLALKADGTLWAWGANFVGELGDGTTTDRAMPVQVGSGYSVVKAGSYHTVGLKRDGSLWAWGSNLFGQLGDGSYRDSATPIKVGSGYIAVAAGTYHTVAVKADGSVWVWGMSSPSSSDGPPVRDALAATPHPVLGIAIGLPSTSDTVTGLWSNPAEAGWGINFNQQGDHLFATLFSYDASGQPLWLVMSNGVKQADSDSFVGALYQTTGPAFNAQPFTPLSAPNVTQVGNMAVTFTSASTAILNYAVFGAAVNKAIQPQLFGSRAALCQATQASRTTLSNYQDLWWNPGEPGWGVNLAHQDNTLFATLFSYDTTGRGMWLVMPAGLMQIDGSYLGELYRTTGAAFNALPFTPTTAANVAKVGSMRFRFADGANGTLNYTVNGLAVAKVITRQEFSTPLPACAS